MGRRLLMMFVVAAIGAQCSLATAVTVEPGTRLQGTLTNRAGETSSLSLRFVRCGANRFGVPYCKGRFRACGGPGCVGRAGRFTFRPAWRNGPLLSLFRGSKECHLHVVPDPNGTALTGTYRCIEVDFSSGDTPGIAPFDRGTFVLTENAS